MTSAEAIKTDSVTRRVAWITAANLLGFALSFLTPLLLVRRLNQSDYGIYRQSFQILTTAVAMLNLQVATSAFYFVPRRSDKKVQIFNNILIFYGLAGLLIAVVFAVYPQWTNGIFQSPALVPHVPLIGLAVLLWTISSSLEVFPLALDDARASAVFIVVSQFTKTAMLITAALFFPSVYWILWAAVIQGILQTLATIGYIRYSLGRFYQPFDWPLFRGQLRNAIPYGMGGLVQSFQGDLHNYFVSYHFPPAMFAVYAVGCFQIPLFGMFEGAFVSVLVPEMSRLEAKRDFQGIADVWANSSRKLALVFFPSFAYLFVMRYEVITLLFTKAYEAAVPVFAVFSLNLLLSITLTGPIVRAFAELKFFRLKLSLVLFPATWGALYLGIRVAGLAGAVAAVVGIYALDRLVTLLTVWRKLDLRAGDVRRFTPILTTGLVSAGAGLAAYLVKQPLENIHAAPKMAVCGLVFALVYVATGLVMGAITNEERTQLLLWWKKYAPTT